MKKKRKVRLLLILLLLPVITLAQVNPDNFEIYGYIQTDVGYNFNSIDPDWFDVMRPTKLPKYKGQFGPSGNFFISVRQTRFGVRSITKTKLGELKTQFDFDFYGFGKDAGQTTIHLVNGYGQLGKILAGQTPSTFMDTEVFPVTLDYWGPSSRIFYLNLQIRFTAINTSKQRFAIALERPGGTADATDYSNTVDIKDVRPRLPMPNVASHYRRNWNWGYIQLAGIFKYLQWKEILDTAAADLSGSDIGWGFNASTVINVNKRLRLKLQGEYGEGFVNYIADPSPDVALESNPGNPTSPVNGKALPVWGFFAFTEVDWTPDFKSSMGFSMLTITNTDLQAPDAFRKGQYALFNMRWYPVPNFMLGIEYQYGKRFNHNDGFSSNGNKVQWTFKYNFSHKIERQ